MKKTIGLFAHVDAGKTTFSEQILYHTNIIHTLGRVDNKNTFLDSHDIEKKRGITIFSDQANFVYNNNIYYLIDTPGHIDFSSEMQRAIKIIDYAIIIISATDGVESHTETIFELLKAENIPIFIFINKIDQNNADINKVILEIQNSLAKNAIDFNNGDLKDSYEDIALYDDILLELFFNEEFSENIWDEKITNLIKNNKIIPIFTGSALKDINIDKFIYNFDKYTVTNYDNNKLSWYVYKIKHDNKGVKHTYIKLFGGELNIRDYILDEKITQIKIYNGIKYISVDKVKSGDVFSIMGIKNLKIGDSYNFENKNNNKLIPTLSSKLKYDDSLFIKDVLSDMRILEMEDPSLNVYFNDESKEILMNIMGVIQIEVLEDIIVDRFGYVVKFDDPTIIYKETIVNEVDGYGHFEPLKHYSEVHLLIKKAKRGSGITFESKCSTENLNIGHQNLIEHYIFEKIHRGILTGSELTDIKIVLLDGRFHNQYTAGGDFREATIRALRQGLEQAENILLEPIYKIKITVPIDFMGRVMTDIKKAYGESEVPIQLDKKIIINANVPVSEFMNYSKKLASFTSGKGKINLTMVGYKECHNQNEVIEKIDYKKELDINYPSSSVFCTKGKGYTIKWDEAKKYMHCLK